MTAPEDVGQAERRTAPGGGSGSLRGAPLAGGSSGYRSGPLNLIHRNNSPKPLSMRVCGRLNLVIRPLRTALYYPVRAVPYLPGGPLRWLWIVRLVAAIDTPLRNAYIDWRGLHARSE